MKSARESGAGFTIVEVVLFLALSATMIVAAMIAVSGRTQSVQYSDSVQSTEAFFDRRITQVLSGAVTGETQECSWNGATYSSGSSDGTCIFLGYLFHVDFSQRDQLEVIQMYGVRLPSNDPCFAANPNDPLYCVRPTPTPVDGVPAAVETFQIPWGLYVRWTWSGTVNSQYFGYLRNPVGQNLIPVSFGAGFDSELDNPDAYRVSSSMSQVGDEFSAIVCLTNGTDGGRIVLGNHEDQFAVVSQLGKGVVSGCGP